MESRQVKPDEELLNKMVQATLWEIRSPWTFQGEKLIFVSSVPSCGCCSEQEEIDINDYRKFAKALGVILLEEAESLTYEDLEERHDKRVEE